jgi:DNA-binding NtrC family response regulator
MLSSLFGRRVLLVEDDEVLRKALELTFQDWGLKVFTAADFKGVLCFLEDGRFGFDALVTDYDLAGDRNGLEIIDAVRERRGSWIPALIISGRLSDLSPDALDEFGVRSLEKPVDFFRLRRELELLLEI